MTSGFGGADEWFWLFVTLKLTLTRLASVRELMTGANDDALSMEINKMIEMIRSKQCGAIVKC